MTTLDSTRLAVERLPRERYDALLTYEDNVVREHGLRILTSHPDLNMEVLQDVLRTSQLEYLLVADTGYVREVGADLPCRAWPWNGEKLADYVGQTLWRTATVRVNMATRSVSRGRLTCARVRVRKPHNADVTVDDASLEAMPLITMERYHGEADNLDERLSAEDLAAWDYVVGSVTNVNRAGWLDLNGVWVPESRMVRRPSGHWYYSPAMGQYGLHLAHSGVSWPDPSLGFAIIDTDDRGAYRDAVCLRWRKSVNPDNYAQMSWGEKANTMANLHLAKPMSINDIISANNNNTNRANNGANKESE